MTRLMILAAVCFTIWAGMAKYFGAPPWVPPVIGAIFFSHVIMRDRRDHD